MRKVTVLIIGTNATGKTTLAKNLLNIHGGVGFVCDEYTISKDGKLAAIGDYVNKKFAGVDAFGETRCVANIIESIDNEIVLFEGVKCGTFGLSIQSALFKAPRQLIILLYAPAQVINERLLERSGTGIKSQGVLKQQLSNFSAAKKYKKVGVHTFSIDTSKYNAEEIAQLVKEKIEYELQQPSME